MLKPIIKIILIFHNFLYKVISKLAIKENRGIHPKHELMKYADFFLKNIDTGDAILDIGCGNGMIEKTIAKEAGHIIAIDINCSLIEKNRRINSFPNVDYICVDIFEYDGGNFDVVILSNLLEHLDRRKELLLYLHKTSSRLLIRVPLIDRDWLTLYKRKMGIDYRLDRTHRIEYTLNEFKEETFASGWNMIDYSIKFGELYAILVPYDSLSMQDK